MTGETLDAAIEKYKPSHVFALFSGGHDSLVSTHITAQHPRFSGVYHANTGIGIDETREFVRVTCKQHGWPLYEGFPPRKGYVDMLLERGMPGGPKHHEIMYHRLKLEGLNRYIHSIKEKRSDRVILSTGIRHAESERRMRLHPEPMRRDGSKVWVNPILDFSKQDVNRYIEEHGLTRNVVVDKLHRSGECLCGALARPEELDEIAFWYPEVGARIRSLEYECFKRGLPHNWGSKPSPKVDERQGQFLELCQSCETRWDSRGTKISSPVRGSMGVIE